VGSVEPPKLPGQKNCTGPLLAWIAPSRWRRRTWGGEEGEAPPPDERRLRREEGGPGLRRPVGRRPDGEAADGEAQQIAAAARRKKPSARIKPPHLPEA